MPGGPGTRSHVEEKSLRMETLRIFTGLALDLNGGVLDMELVVEHFRDGCPDHLEIRAFA